MRKISLFCFIIKNSAIFAASNDYKFRQNYVLNRSLINIKALIPFIPL